MKLEDLEFWVLDFTDVKENRTVQAQGRTVCIKTNISGFFSIELGRFPSRQDLAKKEKLNAKITFD